MELIEREKLLSAIYEIILDRSEYMVTRMEGLLTKTFGTEIGSVNTKTVIWAMLAKVSARKLKELCPDIAEGRN